MTYEEFLDILEELEFDLDTASEGLDIKSLTTLILATPKTDIVQSVGRILRQKHAQPLVVDIIDSHDVFQKQFKQRKTFYNKKKYKIFEANHND